MDNDQFRDFTREFLYKLIGTTEEESTDQRRVIREEKRRPVNENVWARGESTSALLSFGRAYAGLGGAVQDQVDALVDAYLAGGAREWDPNQHFLEVVYEQNPNAIEMAYNALRNSLQMLGDENAGDVLDALKEAMNIIRQGEEEVARDRAAAEEG